MRIDMAVKILRRLQMVKIAGVGIEGVILQVVYADTSVRSTHIRLRRQKICLYLIDINYANVEVDIVPGTSMDLSTVKVVRQKVRQIQSVNCACIR